MWARSESASRAGSIPCTCFFFQAEDGIRDLTVTGVQTCALPISNDVVVRLLGRERTARCLGVEAQPPGARIARLEALDHGLMPDAPRGTILSNLLEEIIVRVEEKGKLGYKLVHLKAATHSPFDILESVAQGKSQFLNRRGACLADRSEEHTSELQSQSNLVCRLLLEKKK